MPKTVEALGFDTKLFGFQTGRIVLDDKDLPTLDRNPALLDVLKNAYSTGYKLIYLLDPTQNLENGVLPPSSRTYLGTLVDRKSTLVLQLQSLDKAKLLEQSFMSSLISIKAYNSKERTEPSQALCSLAITSGMFSRFKVDSKIPQSGFEALFSTWLKNSCNHTVADEVFVAQERGGERREVGFITVSIKNASVNIGLLAVDASCRRLGIAKALLSRASLWALEQIGYLPNASMNVVTQGINEVATACYESFGFQLSSVQDVYHIWLPDDLPTVSQADQNLVPFCRQHLAGKELGYIQDLLGSSGTGSATGTPLAGIDSVGRYNLACSSLIQGYLGEHSSRVLVTPSCTAALELAALLCDLQPGDEVIMPSYTFASTANAFVLRGAVPVFVDVCRDTANLDASLLEAAVSPKTRVICAVHYAGVACDMDVVCEFAKKHGLLVVEDAAQGFLSSYKGRPLGSIGDFGCISFHYTKNVICGEGGCISINRNDQAAQRAVVMWEKGTNRYDFMMGAVSKYEWIEVGSSFVPSELSCAFLLAQLEVAQQTTQQRLRHYAQYQQGLRGLETHGLFKLCVCPAYAQTNAHIFFLVFRDPQTRQIFQDKLKALGVSSFTHYVPLHSAPAGKKYGRAAGALPVTDDIAGCLLRLPVWTDMSAQQVAVVIAGVQSITDDMASR